VADDRASKGPMKSADKVSSLEKRSRPKQATAPSAPRSPDLVRFFVPLLVALATVVAFLPVLLNDFVNWDDYEILLKNPHYRTLGWEGLRWMFTTFYWGHYQPLTWVTFYLDYVAWGMEPWGYHLTNLLLHAANSVLFYFIAVRLLSLGLPNVASPRDVTLPVAAGFASLVFAVHPLRVESVAWATERRDVLSGLFLFWTLLCYLRASAASSAGRTRIGWLSATMLVFTLSLLSKASGIVLPFVFLVLDAYPLRRLGGQVGWIGREARRVWWEKVPFFLLAIVFGIVALFAQREAEALKPLEAYPISHRLAQGFFGIAFYAWKTVMPLGLSPLYQIPLEFNPWDWPFLLSGVIVLAVSMILLVASRRWPAGLAIWIYYLVVLSPVLGTAQSGVQFVADRYSYLSCLGWAILAGAGLYYALRVWVGGRMNLGTFAVTAGLAVVTVVGLAVMTWKQVQVWHDPERLWRRVLSVDPKSSVAHNNLGNALLREGKVDEAIPYYRHAVELDPTYAAAHHNLAYALASNGKLEEAIQRYRQALHLGLPHAEAYHNLGNALFKEGKVDEAIQYYRQALEIKPAFVDAHDSLGLVLASQGKFPEAVKHLRRSVELMPGRAEAYLHLGTALARTGDIEEAIVHLQRAVEIQPDFPEAHLRLGVVMAAQGRLDKAVDQFRLALRIKPEFAEAHESLGRALAELGKRDEAIGHYQEALRIMRSRSEARSGR